MSSDMTGAWDSGYYADPKNPYNREAWDVDGDGIIDVNPVERNRRFYYPPPSMLDPYDAPQDKAREIAGAIVTQNDFTPVRDRVETQAQAITTLEAVQESSRATNAWVSPDIQDMASFPYWYMQPVPELIRIPQGNYSYEAYSLGYTKRVNDHTHRFVNGRESQSSNTDPSGGHYHEITMVNPAYSPLSRSIEFSVVPVDRFAYLTELKFCSGRDRSIYAIESMLASAYVLNPLNGFLEKFWASPELKGQYVKSQKMYTVDVTEGGANYQQSTPGQSIFVGVWQDGDGFTQNVRSLGCAYMPMYEIETKSWLKTGAFVLEGQAGMPASIDFSLLKPNYSRQFWAAFTTG